MPNAESREALVVTTFGRRLQIQLAGGERPFARIKGRRLRAVCGDRVDAVPIPNESDWLITNILPRDNELTRPDSRGRKEVLAANLTCLVCVAADPPRPDWFIIDRYLSAAELMGIKGIIVFNKVDLQPASDESLAVLHNYESIGYPVVLTSTVTGESIERLQALLTGEVAMLVGQSGVGKSSIINQLTSGGALRTGEVSARSGEGRHTTVNSAMLDLPGGGAVIDSPGVRDYAPSVAEPDQIVFGFREIAETGQHCRYPNCRHLREPKCAVKDAVDANVITRRRYDSYKRLVHLTNQLNPAGG